jgi:hypothetical protein
MSVTEYPSPPTESSAQLPRWLWALTGCMGLGLVGLGGGLVALPFLFAALIEGASAIIAGYGLFAITLGVALVTAGVRGWRQEPSYRYYSRSAWLYFLVATVVIALLAVILPRELHATALFAPFHFALILLPGLLLLSLVAMLSGSDSAVAARHLSLAAGGGAASVMLAVPLELIGLLFSIIAGVAVAWLLPGGAEEVERLVILLEGWTVQPPTTETEILGLLASPLILFALALLLGVIAPLVEEFGKTLVLGLMGIWVKPSVRVSFILGVACGLGFAWLEGISNGGLGLGERAAWLGGVGARVFATAMHGLTSGVMGIGWAYFRRRKRWALLLSYVVAVVFHGLWNLNVVMSLGGMGVTASSPALGGLVVVLGTGFQIVLIAICLLALIAIPVQLRRRDLATMVRTG